MKKLLFLLLLLTPACSTKKPKFAPEDCIRNISSEDWNPPEYKILKVGNNNYQIFDFYYYIGDLEFRYLDGYYKKVECPK